MVSRPVDYVQEVDDDFRLRVCQPELRHSGLDSGPFYENASNVSNTLLLLRFVLFQILY